MPYKKILLFIFLSFTSLFALEVNDTLKTIEHKFESFEYRDVIASADSILNSGTAFSRDLLINLYLIKGISHFSLLQEKEAEESFRNILKLDSAFVPDTIKTSPKIIAFYDSVKAGYVQQEEKLNEQVSRVDTVYVLNDNKAAQEIEEVKGSVARSLILPGWGHLFSGNKTKGIILFSAGTAALISSVYFIIDTNNKEDIYINEKNPGLISSKYSDYNSSYRMRNYSLIAFGLIWLYSQIDLLFLSGEQAHDIPLSINMQGHTPVNISFRYSF